jgi:hypothetical protein
MYDDQYLIKKAELYLTKEGSWTRDRLSAHRFHEFTDAITRAEKFMASVVLVHRAFDHTSR